MFKTKSSIYFFFALILCLPLVSSCWYPGQQIVRGKLAEHYQRVESQERKKIQGYVFDVGRIVTVGFKTPIGLKERIEFELTNKLKQKGLIATQNESRERLWLNIEIEATVPPFAPRGYYDEIQSRVVVTDINKTEIVAEKKFRTLKAASWSTDFTEITHAGQIASYLESIVR